MKGFVEREGRNGNNGGVALRDGDSFPTRTANVAHVTRISGPVLLWLDNNQVGGVGIPGWVKHTRWQ